MTQLTIFDGKEKMCEIVDITGKDLQLTENIASFKVKDVSFVLDAENYKANTCGFDVEVTMTNGDVIEVVYYGISVPLTISGGIK